MAQAPVGASPFVSESSTQSLCLAQHSSAGSSTRGLLKCPCDHSSKTALESGCCASRPLLVTTVCLPILLIGVIVCSLVPLAGNRGGWAAYSGAGLASDSLRNLGLVNWNHTIDIGYDQQTNAIRQYSWAQHWVVNGQPMQKYAKLWENFMYGDAAQLVGGYCAAFLALSALEGAAFLGAWAWALRRALAGCRGAPAAPLLPGAALTEGRLARLEEEASAAPPKRPPGAVLAPWLWPFAIANMVVLVALLLSFFLLVRASTAWQSTHVAPGVQCDVVPGLYWWLALAAALGWGAAFVLAVVEVLNSDKLAANPRAATLSPAASGRHSST